MRRRWPLLVLVLAPLLALWPGLTGLAVGPFDQIRQLAPWNGPAAPATWDVLMADSVLQSHVWRTLVLDAWGKGQLPLWNPYQFAGTPLLANSQSGGFYPPHIVLGLLHVGAGLAGFLLAWFHLALASLGTYALVRRLGGSQAGGLTAGLSFGLSPFLLGWTPLSSVLATVAWIPLALACVADIRNRLSFVALAACVGMVLLAGHLQFAAYGIMAIVLFAAVHLPLSSSRGTPSEDPSLPSDDERGPGGEQDVVYPKPASWRAGIYVLLALVIGAGLAAPQLLPVLRYSTESHRRNSPTEEGYQAYIASAVQPYELANLGHPMALGSPRQPSGVQELPVSSYWPALLRRNFAESAITLGALAMALLFAAPWRRRETWPLAAVGGVALLLALGTPLNRLLYFFVPGWSSTGSPGRIEVLFVLAACALAGLAVDRITERKAQLAAGSGLLIALLLAFVMPGLAQAEGPAAVLRGLATTNVLPSLVVALLLAGAAIYLAKKSPWAVPAGAALIAVWTHATGLVPFGEQLEVPKGDPTIRIAVVNDAWDIATAQPAVLPPNLASLGGIHELSGYDSLTSRDAVEMLRTVNGGNDPAPPVNGNMMFVKPMLNPKALADCGVTEVWSRRPLPQLGAFVQREGYVVQKVNGPGRVTGGRVIDGYDRLRLVANPGRSIEVRDRLSDEWAYGRVPPSAITSRLQPFGRSIVTPQTKPTGFEAELIYRPRGLQVGLGIGATAWLALLGLALLGWKNSRQLIRPNERGTET